MFCKDQKITVDGKEVTVSGFCKGVFIKQCDTGKYAGKACEIDDCQGGTCEFASLHYYGLPIYVVVADRAVQKSRPAADCQKRPS